MMYSTALVILQTAQWPHVGMLISGLSSLGSSPGWVYCVEFWSRHFTLTVAHFACELNHASSYPVMDQHPIYWSNHYTSLGTFCKQPQPPLELKVSNFVLFLTYHTCKWPHR